MAPRNQPKNECGAGVGPGPPGSVGSHLQIVFVALGLLGSPGRVQAALEVAQDQAADDLFMGLLEQLLKQPQRGDANLGQEGVSRMPLPAPASGGAWESAHPDKRSTPRRGSLLPGRIWGEWMGGGLGIRSLAGLGSIINLICNDRQENGLFCASVSMSEKWSTGLHLRVASSLKNVP